MKQLDDNDPQTRDKAQEELTKIGIRTLYYFDEIKNTKLSVEQRTRIEQIKESLSNYREFEKQGLHKSIALIVKLLETTKEKDALLKHLVTITSYDKKPVANDILEWFEKNKEKLAWDEKSGKYVQK